MNCTKKTVSALLCAGLLAVPACLSVPAFAAEDPEPPVVIAPASVEEPALIAPAPVEEPAVIAPAPAAETWTLRIDGKDVGVEPVVMVPLRAVSEKLGWTVTWQAAERNIRVDTGDVYTVVTPGVDEYFITTSHEDMIGMSAPFSLGLASYISQGVTYAPLSLFDALIGIKGAVTVDGSVISVNTKGSTGGNNADQIPSPFQDCKTMDEAKALAGFDFQVPESIDGYSKQTIQAISNEMIQVFYRNDTSDVILRKGTDKDVSGNYNTYAQITNKDANGVTVTLKGNNGKVFCAIWTDGGYGYAINAEDGLSEAAVLSLAAAMK